MCMVVISVGGKAGWDRWVGKYWLLDCEKTGGLRLHHCLQLEDEEAARFLDLLRQRQGAGNK